MSDLPDCPVCAQQNTYVDEGNFICPDCAHEWPVKTVDAGEDDAGPVVRDANGNLLQDGDAVVIVKDLKLRGSSEVLKIGTKVRSIRLVDGDHDLEGRIDGVAMMLKSKFVKKA